MRKQLMKVAIAAVAVALVWMAPNIAEAGRLLLVSAELVQGCANCGTPSGAGGSYSVLGDGLGAYEDGNGVKSQIINHNTVYNLDTLDTLVNGQVGAGTRSVTMHFYSPVESNFPGHNLPACWNGNYTQHQAVNWIVLAPNKQTLTGMTVGQQVEGRARMDFNVRDAGCNGQIFRYYLQWYTVCITRTGTSTWDATSDACGKMENNGTANLRGQGGKKGQTVDYGDWRMPFRMTLTTQ